MASQDRSKASHDKAKKRKRDPTEADKKSKRPRSQADDGETPGAKGKKTTKNSVLRENAPSPNENGLQISNYKPHEVIRQTDDGESGWKISQPMGGRMLDIDPILTDDERFLILAYNTSIQVFTVTDSLLLRRIPISTLDTTASTGSKPANIVATRISVQSQDHVWVACSDGRVFFVDWANGAEAVESFQTNSKTAKAMAVIPTNFGTNDDMVLIVEADKPNRAEVVGYRRTTKSAPSQTNLLNIKKSGSGLHMLEASADGRFIIGALHDRIFVGTAKNENPKGHDEVKYDFVSFDAPDLITALDMRVHSSALTIGAGNKHRRENDDMVDLIAGGARGSIYLYRDLLSQAQAIAKSNTAKDSIQPRKYHWHRRAVHSVKWSQDGNYMISGGSENSLVLWQMDTSRKDFLPHLSGSVENIVVSVSGSSYVVHLDDNSTMVLSTAEMKPNAYIGGIQSAAVDVCTPKDQLVQRVWTSADQVRRPVPAAIRPTDPSKLHVCVGNGRQASMTGAFSTPLLQSLDLETFTNAAKQALARTQPTDVNITSKGNPIDEPAVTHIAFSGDGKWLASVDDWVPSSQDVANLSNDARDQFIRDRHEVFLKFWDVRNNESIALVSRVNSPHATNYPEDVLDLASDPVSACFATIGSDGNVRLWRTKTRHQNGIPVTDASGETVFAWSCSQTIPIGDGIGQHNLVDLASVSNTPQKAQGSLAFSEDGSTIFAAFGTAESGAVYVIDAASGQIVKTIEGLWRGKLQSVRTLSHFVIVLSEELRVYDVVCDELRYGIVIPPVPGVTELLQIAVDHSSGYFAVTLPIGDVSSIGVFDPEDPEPLLVRSTPHRIVSLVSVPDASGFVALDDAAQIWVIAEGSNASSFTIAQPLQDMQLDIGTDIGNDVDTEVALLADEVEMASDEEVDADEEQDEASDVEMNDDDDDTSYPAVVAQQHLSDIFDAAPAFAAPSVEEMFYKVTGLIASKPLHASAA